MCHLQLTTYPACNHMDTAVHHCAEVLDEGTCSLGRKMLVREEQGVCPICAELLLRLANYIKWAKEEDRERDDEGNGDDGRPKGEFVAWGCVGRTRYEIRAKRE